MCHASLFEYHGKGLGGWRVSPATCAQHWNQCNARAISGPYISSPSARPKHKHCMCHPHQRALVSSESACAPHKSQTAASRSDTHHDLKLERKSDSSLSLKSVANLPVPLILNVVGNGVFRTSMNSSHCPSGTTPCFL